MRKIKKIKRVKERETDRHTDKERERDRETERDKETETEKRKVDGCQAEDKTEVATVFQSDQKRGKGGQK